MSRPGFAGGPDLPLISRTPGRFRAVLGRETERSTAVPLASETSEESVGPGGVCGGGVGRRRRWRGVLLGSCVRYAAWARRAAPIGCRMTNTAVETAWRADLRLPR
jgi:hypothetical protein